MVVGQFMIDSFVKKPLLFQSQNGQSLTQHFGTWLLPVKGPLPQVMTRGSTRAPSATHPASTHLADPHHTPKNDQSVWNGMIVLRQDVRILDAATTIPATGVHTTPMSSIKTTRLSSAQTGKNLTSRMLP